MLLELSLDGDVQLSREILRFAGRSIHAAPAFELLGGELFRIERRQFDSEGGYGSGGWAPLADSTIEAKGTDQILVESGDLERSLTERGGDNIFEIHDTWFLFGTHDPKAALHQKGTSRMPQRRPLELPEHDRRAATKAMQRFMVTGELQGWL